MLWGLLWGYRRAYVTRVRYIWYMSVPPTFRRAGCKFQKGYLGVFKLQKTPTQMRRMYGLFTYMSLVKNGDLFTRGNGWVNSPITCSIWEMAKGIWVLLRCKRYHADSPKHYTLSSPDPSKLAILRTQRHPCVIQVHSPLHWRVLGDSYARPKLTGLWTLKSVQFIIKSLTWMFRPFWVRFPYFSLAFGGIPNRRVWSL